MSKVTEMIIYSKILKERFQFVDGLVKFDSGVVYNQAEIEKLKKESSETKKKFI